MNICSHFNYSMNDYIMVMGDWYPLLVEYKNTPQDPEWHAEGDVHIHTDLVIKEARKLCIKHQLNPIEQSKLLFAALLHDYGKPLATRPLIKQGVERIGAPGHEHIGASLLYHLPKPSYLTDKEWVEVFQLVHYHDYPKKLVIHNAGENSYIELMNAIGGNMKLMYLLETADMLGRTSIDREMQEEMMETFKERAINFGCWEKGDSMLDYYRASVNDLKLDISSEDEQRIANVMINKIGVESNIDELTMLTKAIDRVINKPRVAIFCGLPASGKSIACSALFPDYERISLDDLREKYCGNVSDQSQDHKVVSIAHMNLIKLLKEGKNVVWDATNFSKEFRIRIRDKALKYGAYVSIEFVVKGSDQCIRDDKSRDRTVGKEVIDFIASEFEVPEIKEAHTINYHIM